MCRRIPACLLLFGLIQTGFAVESSELRFAEELAADGFPDLARIVFNRTVSTSTEAEAAASGLRVRILIAEKKFDEAQIQLAAMEDSASLWLFLAETARQARRLPVAESAYQTYFQLGAPADAVTLEAAVQYGELLEERGDLPTAQKLYEQVLQDVSAGSAARPVKVKLARRLIEENPERAKKLCEDVQLGGLDFWFGQAVVIWSEIMTAQEEWDEAQSVLEMQLETLKEIDSALEKQGQPVSSIGTLAGGRYLLGLCYEHAGEKSAALHQFCNVYAAYGDSEWGPPAQQRAQNLIAWFATQGKTVTIDPGANLAKMEASAFRVARRLYFDKQYADAVPAYLEALNRYPEGAEALTALRELTLSFIQLNDPLSAKAVAACIGERFAARESAADALLAAGKCALDRKQDRLADWFYDCYFSSFPQHVRAAAVLYSLAVLQSGAEQDARLRRLLELYPDSPYAARALSRLAWNAYEQEEYAVAAEWFERVLRAETDVQKKTRDRFALAEVYRLSKQWEKALENFQTLDAVLNDADAGVGVPEEQCEQNRQLLGKSLFYQAVCFGKLGEPEQAVQIFNRIFARFPEAEFISQARLVHGAALLELGRFYEALATLDCFDENSDRLFLEPTLYYRAQAFFKTGRCLEAVRCLDRLLNT